MSAVASYSREAIEHALLHHELRGTLHSVQPPEPGGRKTWRVRFAEGVHVAGDAAVTFTWPQAYALCLGLQAGEQIEQRVRLDRADVESPPCVEDEPTSTCGVHGCATYRIGDALRCVECDKQAHREVELLRRGLRALCSALGGSAMLAPDVVRSQPDVDDDVRAAIRRATS